MGAIHVYRDLAVISAISWGPARYGPVMKNTEATRVPEEFCRLKKKRLKKMLDRS